MVGMETKANVIMLKNQGLSNREVARQTGINRETVSKYWEEYKRKRLELISEVSGIDERQVQEELLRAPRYKTGQRSKYKYTDEIEARLKEILKAERRKDIVLGQCHKQSLTNKQIYEILRDEGFDIGQSTINNALSRLRARPKQVFIRQMHDYGSRLEYDFGEVRLIIGGKQGTYHMAVFTSSASRLRWVKLYTNQKKPVFMDSHVRFFEAIGGCWQEVVYDNMKNVVTKFIGKNEKELNPDLIKMSMYYGFKINVTNCFSGHEKGSVEKSIDVIRTQLFATNYTFNTLDDAQFYADAKLQKLNETSSFSEEQSYLLPLMPPLELAQILTAKVDKTSMISIDTVKYSVPEELVECKVVVKKYHDEIRVYYDNKEVCRHRRILGNGKMQVNIMHYLNTFTKKPGAVKTSVALKIIPRLKAIFDTYYTTKPKEFIEILMEHKHQAIQTESEVDIDEIIKVFKEKTSVKAEFNAVVVIRPISSIDMHSRSQMANYSMLVKGNGVQIATETDTQLVADVQFESTTTPTDTHFATINKGGVLA
jgi:transposase